MAFSFFQRTNLVELGRQCKLTQYTPTLVLENLAPGVDNVRHDVYLSARFCEVARAHIFRMLARHANVEAIVQEPQVVQPPPRPSSILGLQHMLAKTPAVKPPGPLDFRLLLAELHVAALNRAKAEGNLSIDLLGRLAVIKLLRHELNLQFAAIVERCRAKLQTMEGPRQINPGKAVEMRERIARLQVNKRNLLRTAGQELFQTLREVEKEKLARMRRSLFGHQPDASYDLLLNRLLFSEDGRDDYLMAEHYVMLGNYDRDPDRTARVLVIASQFLESMDALALAGEYATYDAILSVPDNAQELVAGGSPDESTPKGKAQKAILEAWMETLEREGVMDYVIASYEVVALLAQYWPQVHAQQLKNALISKGEYNRVIMLLEEHGKLSSDALNQAQRRVAQCKGPERGKAAGRFLRDVMRYRRDLRRWEALNAAVDKVNLIGSDKLRELSAINNTLYEFLLPEEQKPAEDKVVNHVILKADVRDSTTLTRTLMERGLNPASYFSLNFYDPVNKLLKTFDATKVFIEGDAVILALFEREAETGFGVSRACVLAREMIQIVGAYNEQSQKSGLPLLELGIGICFQDAAPLYLMDGAARIMISSALNESDRLSSCSKGSRRYLQNRESLFNVFAFQTVDEQDTGGNLDEFLLRYNVGGININGAAFQKLRQEISLQRHELQMPMLWGNETVTLYSGLVPLSSGTFQPLVVREGTVPHIDASGFVFKRWTERRYYEVCTQSQVYELLEKESRAATAD
jgi:hypothetical protein